MARSPDQTIVSISLPKELLTMVDDRARSLGMNRSQYLSRVARADVKAGGEWTIVPQGGSAIGSSMDLAREVTKFLEMAVPALISFEKGATDPQGESAEAQAENQFWQDFWKERQQILDLKWIESEKAERDIGYREAIRIWMKHRPGWLAAQHPQ